VSSSYLKNRSFSLLELIIGIAILSIGIITVLQALSFSLRAAGLSCDIIKAVFLARDKMQDLEFKEKQKLISKEPPQAQGEQDKFSWQYVLTPEADLTLYKLGLNITWQRPNREENLSLNTYLIKK